MSICRTKCPACGILKPKQEYAPSEWNRDNKRGNCNKCMTIRTQNGAPYEYNVCYEWFCAEAFLPEQQHHNSIHTRVCLGCLETRTCISCHVAKYRKSFSNSEWEHARNADSQGKCNACYERSPHGIWFCKGCKTIKSTFEFSKWISTHGRNQDKTARCDPCKEQHEAEEERMRQLNQAMVVKQTTYYSPFKSTVTMFAFRVCY